MDYWYGSVLFSRILVPGPVLIISNITFLSSSNVTPISQLVAFMDKKAPVAGAKGTFSKTIVLDSGELVTSAMRKSPGNFNLNPKAGFS